jgi:hypothetical protein
MFEGRQIARFHFFGSELADLEGRKISNLGNFLNQLGSQLPQSTTPGSPKKVQVDTGLGILFIHRPSEQLSASLWDAMARTNSKTNNVLYLYCTLL